MFESTLRTMSEPEVALLRALRQMVQGPESRQPGDGMRPGPIPYFVLTCSWRDIACAWLGESPGFAELSRARRTLERLCLQKLIFDGVGEPMPVVEVSLLSADPSGVESLGLRITLSGYVPLLLAELQD